MTRPAERREAPHPWKPDVRTDFLPALPAGRQASPSRPVSWSKSYPRWAGLVADFRPQGGFLADTSYPNTYLRDDEKAVLLELPFIGPDGMNVAALPAAALALLTVLILLAQRRALGSVRVRCR